MMKLEIEITKGEKPLEALKKTIEKIKKISSIADLRKLQEEISAEGFGYKEDEKPDKMMGKEKEEMKDTEEGM